MPLLAQKKYTGKFVFTPQWTAHAQFAGYYVAQEKGFYKAEGLDVDIVHPSVSETAMHRIQEAESHATTLPLCLAMEIMDKGVPLVNILQTSMNNSTVIVSRRGKNPLTQKGARVGIWHAGFGQVAICMSRKEHLNYQWIQFTSNFDLFRVEFYSKYKHYNRKGASLSRPNLINQIFKATAPNKVWLGDMTYIPTKEGTLYLAVNIDVFSRKIVGWSMSSRMQDKLVRDCFLQACGKEHPQPGLIVHTDQGSQYTSSRYQSTLRQVGAQSSMSRKGNPYDNAMMESF